MAGADPVVIIGLREMLSSLRDVDKALPKQVTAASKRVADVVADKTRASFSARSGVAPKVAKSVRAQGQARAAYVRIGDSSTPFWGGAEFGSIRFKQFESWRGSGPDAGYSLYPSIRASRDDIVRIYGDAVDEVLRRAFPS